MTVRRAYPFWLFVFVAAGLWLTTAGATRTQPVPTVESYTLPIAVNTNSVWWLVDGSGAVFIAGRAQSGDDRSSAVVYRIADGAARCVLCGLDGAYASPTITIRGNGKAYMTSTDSDGRRVTTWEIPEWQPVSFLSRASSLPAVQR